MRWFIAFPILEASADPSDFPAASKTTVSRHWQCCDGSGSGHHSSVSDNASAAARAEGHGVWQGTHTSHNTVRVCVTRLWGWRWPFSSVSVGCWFYYLCFQVLPHNSKTWFSFWLQTYIDSLQNFPVNKGWKIHVDSVKERKRRFTVKPVRGVTTGMLCFASFQFTHWGPMPFSSLALILIILPHLFVGAMKVDRFRSAFSLGRPWSVTWTHRCLAVSRSIGICTASGFCC